VLRAARGRTIYVTEGGWGDMYDVSFVCDKYPDKHTFALEGMRGRKRDMCSADSVSVSQYTSFETTNYSRPVQSPISGLPSHRQEAALIHVLSSPSR